MYSFRRSIRDSAALSFSVLNVRRLTVALSASLVSFLATVILLSSFFATNDDSYIQMALAGSLSGDYSAFVTFVGFSLTWSVSRLFACIPGVPWWGIVHFVSLFASVVFLNLSLLSLSFSRRFRERGVFSFFVLSLTDFCLFSFFVSRVQFTETGSVAAAVGSMLFAANIFRHKRGNRLDNEMKTRLVPWAFSVPFFLLAFCYRMECGLLALTFCGLAVFIKVVVDKVEHVSFDYRIALHFLIACMVCSIAFGIHVGAYSSPEWKSVKTTIKAFAGCTDYPHATYEDNPSLYDSVGWDESLVKLVPMFFYMDKRETPEALEHVANSDSTYLWELRANPLGTLKTRLSDLANPVVIPFVGLCVLLFIIANTHAERSVRFTARAVFIVALAFLAYLVVRGRMPYRAALSVILPAMGVLAGSLMGSGHGFRFLESRGRFFDIAFDAVALLMLAVLFFASTRLGKVLVLFMVLGLGLISVVRFIRLDARTACHRVCSAMSMWLVPASLVVFIGAAGCVTVYKCGPWSEDYHELTITEQNGDAIYSYAENNPDLLVIFDSAIGRYGAVPRDVWSLRWPVNQTNWGSLFYQYPWFDSTLKSAGFKGTPTTEDLFDDNVRLVIGSDYVYELMRQYLTNLYGDVQMTCVDVIGNGLRVYRFSKD